MFRAGFTPSVSSTVGRNGFFCPFGLAIVFPLVFLRSIPIGRFALRTNARPLESARFVVAMWQPLMPTTASASQQLDHADCLLFRLLLFHGRFLRKKSELFTKNIYRKP